MSREVSTALRSQTFLGEACIPLRICSLISKIKATMTQILQWLLLGIGLSAAVLPVPDRKLAERPVNIRVIDSGLAYEISVNLQSHQASPLNDVLAKAGLDIGAEDIVSPGKNVPAKPGMTVVIARPRTARVFADSKAVESKVFGDAISEIIEEIGIPISEFDRVDPGRNLPLPQDGVFRIFRVAEKELSEEKTVPAPEIIRKDPELPFGKRIIVEKGESGKEKLWWRIKYEDNKEVGRTLLRKELVTPPKPTIIAVGAKIEIGRTQEGEASWYRFRKGMYAASAFFSRGTLVRVTNLLNDKQVIVKINDFGPLIPGRIIDLEAAAFKMLAPLARGTIPVRVEEIL